jgi:hypothetical protein
MMLIHPINIPMMMKIKLLKNNLENDW